MGIAVLAIGLDLAFVTYRVETQEKDDPRVVDVMNSAARAHKRQMGLLYGETSAEMMAWASALDEPAGHATLMGLLSVIAAILCFRAAYLSGPER